MCAKGKILAKHLGFTLIEMVFTIMIMAIISVVVGRVLFQGYNTMLTSDNISSTGWQGLIALERMSNGIHNIRSSSDITTISANTFGFTDVNGTAVTYTLSGSNLLRNGNMLANGVSSLIFTYLDSSGATTATATNVRYIRIAMTLVKNNMSIAMSTMVGTRGLT